MGRPTHEEPAACTLTGSEQMSRRERWLRLAEVALVAKVATEGGVELSYRGEPAVLSELRELARLETECCGFAEWTVRDAGSRIVLEVETEQTKAPAVWAMFDEDPPASSDADARGTQAAHTLG